MKKVLFILPSLGIGGLEREQVTLANALDNEGYDVTIMILDNIRDLANELNSSVKLIHKPYKKHLGNKIPYIRHKYYDDGMWETRATPKELYNYYVGKDKYDVEIAFFRGMSVKIVSGCPYNIKKLAWVHSDFKKAYGYMNNFNSVREVNDAYRKFNRVICVSNQVKNSFINVIGDTHNLSVIYNMLPIDEIINKSSEIINDDICKEAFHIVLVGRLLDSAKGQLRLINVIKRLHNEDYKISLCLVGDGQDRKIIEDSIKDIGFITMVGSKKNSYPYIKQSDLLVCASYYEGYNLTVAESLIIGTPVLSTNCAGPNEILDNGKYGMIVDNTEEGLYEGIKSFCNDRKLLEHYKNMCKERIEFFNVKKEIINVIDD